MRLKCNKWTAKCNKWTLKCFERAKMKIAFCGDYPRQMRKIRLQMRDYPRQKIKARRSLALNGGECTRQKAKSAAMALFWILILKGMQMKIRG